MTCPCIILQNCLLPLTFAPYDIKHMNAQKNIQLLSPSGRPLLADLYYHANGIPKPVIVFIHGFKGFKDWGCWNLFAEAFTNAGFVYVKFNFSHNGVTTEKPTEFADLEAFGRNTYSKELADLDMVISWLCQGKAPIPAEEMDTSRLGLAGHSRGGGIALLQAARDARVKAVATWAGVDNLAFLWESNPALEAWKQQGVIHIFNARTGQEMPVYIDVYHDYTSNQPQLNVEHAMKHLHKPCLIIHGTGDTSVPIHAAKRLHGWNPASELIVLEGADHVFGAQQPFAGNALPPDSRLVVDNSIAFFTQHLNNKF